jgi:hypothetical protein
MPGESSGSDRNVVLLESNYKIYMFELSFLPRFNDVTARRSALSNA